MLPLAIGGQSHQGNFEMMAPAPKEPAPWTPKKMQSNRRLSVPGGQDQPGLSDEKNGVTGWYFGRLADKLGKTK